jgi:hypothetical protein
MGHDTSIDKVKIFGERHTGTNAIENFVRRNFHVSFPYYEYLGWKHRRAPRAEEWRKVDVADTLFIFTVRNPYSWLHAMHREPYAYHEPYLKKLSFEDFLGTPIEEYENVLFMWGEKYRSYLQMVAEVPHSLFVHIEAFNDDQRSLYRNLEKVLATKGEFVPFDKYVNGTGVKMASVSDSLSVPELSKESLRFIASTIDRRLLEQFSYPLM